MSNSRIYIGKLSRDAQEKDVEKFFKRYGDIKEINLKNNRNSRYECGFGFVEFNDYRDAEDAVKDSNDTMFLGHRITVELAHGEKRTRDDRNDRRGDRDSRFGPPQHTNYRIIVDNISSSVRWQDLKDYFRKIGKVTFADAHKRREGEGVVEFENYDDMKDALRKLDETELNGRKIYLREDSRSRRRSRSRSGSRSRSKRSHYSSSRYRSRSDSRSRSRSRSRRSRDDSRSHSRYRSRSRTPRSRTPRSRSRSPRSPRSPHSNSRSRSRSPRSRSESQHSQARSRSNSPRSASVGAANEETEKPNQNEEHSPRSPSPLPMNQDSPQ